METPFTTVMESVVEVDVSKFAESVGVKIAVKETEPKDAGVQEHVAVVDAALADPQPEIVEPPNRKLTAPALETVAVMVTAPPSAALVALLGSEIEIVVDAFATLMVNALEPLCGVLPLSVAMTFCVYVPAGVEDDAVTVLPEMETPLGVAESE